MICHELKNPLTAILSYLQIVTSGLVGDVNEKQREILERVEYRIEGLFRLAENLLQLSSVEAGGAILFMEPLHIEAILRDTVSLIETEAANRKIKLVSSIPERLPIVLADRDSIERVFTNLILNAVKYTDENGAVSVNACVENDHVKVEVADTGIGIPQEELSKIFDKFFRLKTTRTGAGMGLPIVKTILDAHHGTISVQSAVGKGSTFTVRLPVCGKSREKDCKVKERSSA